MFMRTGTLASVPFFDGVRCVARPTVRDAVKLPASQVRSFL
jgi:hypothetical protein